MDELGIFCHNFRIDQPRHDPNALFQNLP